MTNSKLVNVGKLVIIGVIRHAISHTIVRNLLTYDKSEILYSSIHLHSFKIVKITSHENIYVHEFCFNIV